VYAVKRAPQPAVEQVKATTAMKVAAPGNTLKIGPVRQDPLVPALGAAAPSATS
jgi:hypothetical protein